MRSSRKQFPQIDHKVLDFSGFIIVLSVVFIFFAVTTWIAFTPSNISSEEITIYTGTIAIAEQTNSWLERQIIFELPAYETRLKLDNYPAYITDECLTNLKTEIAEGHQFTVSAWRGNMIALSGMSGDYIQLEDSVERWDKSDHTGRRLVIGLDVLFAVFLLLFFTAIRNPERHPKLMSFFIMPSHRLDNIRPTVEVPMIRYKTGDYRKAEETERCLCLYLYDWSVSVELDTAEQHRFVRINSLLHMEDCKLESLPLWERQKGTIWIENMGSGGVFYSDYYPFARRKYYDRDKNQFAIGDIYADGKCIEFSHGNYALLDEAGHLMALMFDGE